MKRMLFNATQAEELRVAIVDGQKLIDLDIESAAKEQRKSNIYKGVVTRVEPSLEAAFVNYGEERHGFLPFKEISRAYFQPGTDAGKARIQDVIKEGQELIVQVEKDERGNKGAALTTFISLAGRYLVLMPNNPRGGGVSRRVEGDERAELREVMDQLQVPSGMSLIARTAAIGRNAEELQWDLNYLLQLWTAIEGAASQQNGPFLIYLEGSLVIRAIRDYFQPDIGEILIDTDEIFEQARAFMGTVMPPNVNRVKRYRDDVPLFSRFQIEHQIESAYSRQVSLPSGGAVVIDHTEALVAVDVNSGRATRGADIEETAFKTNLEAADELARQLRLRDLGGLIVIDFIDMESSKNQREVENRLRDALRHDRARVQMGKISRFGLMELSRQRLRPALAETSYIPCPRCTGTGHIRSTESAALHILRILEEEAMKDNTGAVHTQVPVDVATFLLNEKRADVQTIELRHKVSILLIPNIHLETPQHTITRLKHDDLNHEERFQASYRMVETPPEEQKLPRAQGETAQPRQQAAIKSITPEQPAPVVPEKAETVASPRPAAEAGFFARIFSWFRSDKAEQAPVAETGKPATGKTGNRQEGRGDGNRRRGGRRNEEGRDNRESRESRDNREPREPRAPREQRPPRENREGKENRENRPVAQEAARAGNEATESVVSPRPSGQEGQGRRQRGEGRNARREQNAAAEAANENVQQIGALETPAETTPAGDEGAAGGRRRGRRNRRGERRNEGADAAPLAAVTAEEAAAAVVQEETASTDAAQSAVARSGDVPAGNTQNQPEGTADTPATTVPDTTAITAAAPLPPAHDTAAAPVVTLASAGSETSVAADRAPAEQAPAPAVEAAAASAATTEIAPQPVVPVQEVLPLVQDTPVPEDSIPAASTSAVPAVVAEETPSTPVAVETIAVAETAESMSAPTATDAATPEPKESAPAAAAPDISQALADSGLVMVQTRNDAPVAATGTTETTPRPRRRRPAPVVVSDEPLVMVETHKES